tara:strand:- start:522 stop:1433 length:912 start_codon:yes stop_codon:yes gene_type:complete
MNPFNLFDNSDFNNSDFIAIVANDAGAANLILGWIRYHNKFNYCYCLDGPALKIFKEANLVKENLNLESALIKSDIIITGTSHSSIIEHNARYYAKKFKKISIAIIDHWVNYEIRFIRKNRIILPDIIWVFDEYAEKIAIETFQNTIVQKQNNYYLKELVENIKSLQEKKDSSTTKILYVLEPIRKNLINGKLFEIEVLNHFLDKVRNLSPEKEIIIKLRLHPSEEEIKYEKWVKKNEKFNLSLSLNNSLEQDIAWSDIVVGYESFALVIAKAASKRCFSSKMPFEGNSRLMIKDLEYLRDFD